MKPSDTKTKGYVIDRHTGIAWTLEYASDRIIDNGGTWKGSDNAETLAALADRCRRFGVLPAQVDNQAEFADYYAKHHTLPLNFEQRMEATGYCQLAAEFDCYPRATPTPSLYTTVYDR